MSYRPFVAVLILACPLLQGCAIPTPRGSLRATLQAANAGNYRAATNGLASFPTFYQLDKAGAMPEVWDEITKKRTVANIVFDSVDEKGSEAEIEFTLEYKDGSKKSFGDRMILEDGSWKAQGHFILRLFMPELPPGSKPGFRRQCDAPSVPDKDLIDEGTGAAPKNKE